MWIRRITTTFAIALAALSTGACTEQDGPGREGSTEARRAAREGRRAAEQAAQLAPEEVQAAADAAITAENADAVFEELVREVDADLARDGDG